MRYRYIKSRQDRQRLMGAVRGIYQDALRLQRQLSILENDLQDAGFSTSVRRHNNEADDSVLKAATALNNLLRAMNSEIGRKTRRR